MIFFFVAIFGLIVGSFLNALIHRLYSGQSMWFDRSRCVNCHHELGVFDLIPLVSFIFLAGKCRYCRRPISWQYPVVELATAISFILLVQNYGLRITDYGFWFDLVFIATLIVIGVFDFKHFLILDKMVYPAAGLALVSSMIFGRGELIDGLLGAAAISGFFAAQFFASRGRWIGFGDVKFGLFLGLLLGLKLGLAMLFLAYLLGAVVGIVLIMLGRKSMGSKVPFGSFLAVSAIIILLYGNQILNWYLRLIGL